MGKETFDRGPLNIRRMIGAAGLTIFTPHYSAGLEGYPKEYFYQLMSKIKQGERVVLSKETPLLSDHKVRVWGNEHLETVIGRPHIIVTNHYDDNELMRGFWQFQAISALDHAMTEMEPSWIIGLGSKISAPFIGSFYNIFARNFIAPSHDLLAHALGGIFVDGEKNRSKFAEIISTLRTRPVAITPEGTPSTALVQADPRFGALVLHVAMRQSVPVVCIGVWRGGEDLFLRVSSVIEPEQIVAIAKAAQNRTNRTDGVINYVMRVLRNQLPKRLHGYYAAQESEAA